MPAQPPLGARALVEVGPAPLDQRRRDPDQDQRRVRRDGGDREVLEEVVAVTDPHRQRDRQQRGRQDRRRRACAASADRREPARQQAVERPRHQRALAHRRLRVARRQEPAEERQREQRHQHVVARDEAREVHVAGAADPARPRRLEVAAEGRDEEVVADRAHEDRDRDQQDRGRCRCRPSTSPSAAACAAAALELGRQVGAPVDVDRDRERVVDGADRVVRGVAALARDTAPGRRRRRSSS